MKRRDVLKGAAVVAASTFISSRVLAYLVDGQLRVTKGEAKTVKTLTSETYNGETRRLRVELHVYPNKEGKFSARFQELVEDWEQRNGDHFRPIEAVIFEPLMEDGEQWLIHPSWEREVAFGFKDDNLSTLYTEGRNIFRDHLWRVIERAINLREMGYWRQEYQPQFEGAIDGGGMSPGWAHWLMFRRVARKRLHKVVVRFEAVSLTELRRLLGATAPEYARLEDEVEALEALREKGKLSPRAYYTGRFDRLGQLEAEALGSVVILR